jgi:hypothetical protein
LSAREQYLDLIMKTQKTFFPTLAVLALLATTSGI